LGIPDFLRATILLRINPCYQTKRSLGIDDQVLIRKQIKSTKQEILFSQEKENLHKGLFGLTEKGMGGIFQKLSKDVRNPFSALLEYSLLNL